MASSIPLPLAAAILDRSVSVRGSPKRPAPPPAQPLSDKAHQRLIRQAIVQAELEAEEREALRVTKEEIELLKQSVSSVKAEFTDLDGLSWDTPEARQILEQWHAEQAARARPASPSHNVPIRPLDPPTLSFPPSPPGQFTLSLSAAPDLDLTPMPSPVDGPPDDYPMRLSLCVDSRRSSSASTIVPDRDDVCTPVPGMFSSADKENDSPAQTVRPGLPKSHSAPQLAPLDPSAHTHPARPTKSLPPSRIPVRSKSLSAKPPSSRAADPNPTGTRHASLIVRRGGLRALLTAPAHSCAGPASPGTAVRIRSPARRTFADALSASPRRAHPPPRSPARARFGHHQGQNANEGAPRPGSPASKFRIVSAPPVHALPTFPGARPRASSAHIVRHVPGSAVSARAAVPGVPEAEGSGSGSRSPARRAVALPGRACESAPTAAAGREGSGSGSPVRMGKRAREREGMGRASGDVAGDEDEYELEMPPSPSPSPASTRARARMALPMGGVPMRRT